MKKSQQGFSMLEIIIFIALLNAVFVAALSFVISSLYRMKINEHKMHATFHAEELKEWLNGQRETDWVALTGRAGATYCVNNNLSLNTPLSALTSGGCNFNGVTSRPPQIFRRTLTLTQTSPSIITATIDVSWNESAASGGNQLFTESIQLVYTSW